jgi:hypothetical protein
MKGVFKLTERELKEHNKKIGNAILYMCIPLFVVAFAFVIAILV